MPEFNTAILLGLAIALVAGIAVGWLLASGRHKAEKKAINLGWQEQIEAHRVEHNRLSEQNTSLMNQVKSLQQHTDEQKIGMADAQQALEKAGQRVAEMQANEERIAYLENELTKWQQRLPPLVNKFRERDAEARRLQEELDSVNERRFTETMVETVQKDPEETPPASNDREVGPTLEVVQDDLKQIKGIGPAIEKTLLGLGFSRLEQIANLSETDIDRIAEKIRGFRSRLDREDWIGQAQVLLS